MLEAGAEAEAPSISNDHDMFAFASIIVYRVRQSNEFGVVLSLIVKLIGAIPVVSSRVSKWCP